ncbi:MAG: hypothetical protein LBL52_00560 [Rickettsiales bacterium]|jgi:hypothetical protein|nr:hypothetical protein [Rickettsiales bacterium]
MKFKEFFEKHGVKVIAAVALGAAIALLVMSYKRPAKKRSGRTGMSRESKQAQKPVDCFLVAEHVQELARTVDKSLYTSRNRPEANIGRIWSGYYKKYLRQKYGEPGKARRGARCYPNASLPEFKKWLDDTYVGKGYFDKYKKGLKK